MKVRELRVTDIRCRHRGCNAGPGEDCSRLGASHLIRAQDHEDLVALGWQWQEVDPTDRGARKE